MQAAQQVNKNPLGVVGPSSTLDGANRPPPPEDAMIFAGSLPRFKALVSEGCHQGADLANSLLFVVPFILPLARRSVAAAARSVLADCRNAAWLLRWLGSSRAPAALLAAAQARLLDAANGSSKGLHVLAIDSTQHGQQGQHTQNTFSRGNTKARPKKSKRKQKPVQRRSCHCFVFALLLTPAGLRIPYWLPFYTEEHCACFGRQHFSQADLAAQLIDSIPLPRGSRVVVVGDTAFEAKQVRKACARRHWLWVVPLNPERRLVGEEPRPQVLSLVEHLSVCDFRKVSFRLDQGELAKLARVSPKRSKSSKDTRTYWVHQRTAAIHNVGTVALLFSTKNDPNTPGGLKVQKVLISNALTATTEELLGWYSLRWQIELLFKEMKSELGMCQYKLGPFCRVVGWVNLCVLAYCYLEWSRWLNEQQAKGQDKPFWQRARTHDLKEKLRQQVLRADLEEILRLAATTEGQVILKDLLNKIGSDPAATAA